MSTLSSGQSGAASKKPDLAIRFSWVRRYDTDYVIGEMVEWAEPKYASDPPAGWRRVNTGFQSAHADLDHFQIELILSESNYAGEGLRRSVYPSAEYRSPYAVGLPRAEGMVRVLRRLARYQERVEREDGYAATHGQFVVRVARALGVGLIVFDETLSSEYTGERRYAPNADAIRALDRVLEHWQENGKNIWQEERERAEQARRERLARQREEREQAAAAQPQEVVA